MALPPAKKFQQISITKYVFRFHIILNYMFFQGGFFIDTKSNSFIQKAFNGSFLVFHAPLNSIKLIEPAFNISISLYKTQEYENNYSTFIVFSCTDTKMKSNKQTLDFGSFTIETPNGWTKIKAQGQDSYVGRISIDAMDTLDFDLGWYSNSMTEPEPKIIERSMLTKMNVLDTSQYIIGESLEH